MAANLFFFYMQINWSLLPDFRFFQIVHLKPDIEGQLTYT